jgi:hypothetical protein
LKLKLKLGRELPGASRPEGCLQLEQERLAWELKLELEPPLASEQRECPSSDSELAWPLELELLGTSRPEWARER